MAATTTDRDSMRSDGKLKAMKMAAVKIPKGVFVGVNAAGYVTNGADEENLSFAGVSYEGADNSQGSNGDKEIRVEKTGEHMFIYEGFLDQSVVGKKVYIVDNQTVTTDTLGVSYDVNCGVATEILDSNRVRIRIDNDTH